MPGPLPNANTTEPTFAGSKLMLALAAPRLSGKGQIFGGAAEAHEQVVVVRVHDRRSPRKVRKDFDPVRARLETAKAGCYGRSPRGSHSG